MSDTDTVQTTSSVKDSKTDRMKNSSCFLSVLAAGWLIKEPKQKRYIFNKVYALCLKKTKVAVCSSSFKIYFYGLEF